MIPSAQGLAHNLHFIIYVSIDFDLRGHMMIRSLKSTSLFDAAISSVSPAQVAVKTASQASTLSRWGMSLRHFNQRRRLKSIYENVLLYDAHQSHQIITDQPVIFYAMTDSIWDHQVTRYLSHHILSHCQHTFPRIPETSAMHELCEQDKPLDDNDEQKAHQYLYNQMLELCHESHQAIWFSYANTCMSFSQSTDLLMQLRTAIPHIILIPFAMEKIYWGSAKPNILVEIGKAVESEHAEYIAIQASQTMTNLTNKSIESQKDQFEALL